MYHPHRIEVPSAALSTPASEATGHAEALDPEEGSLRTSLVVQVVKTPRAGGLGSIPGQGTKIPRGTAKNFKTSKF